MQIFLSENGQRTGPFTPWEVRGRLERKEISPDMLGWHDGCENWMPLRELPYLGYRDDGSQEIYEGSEPLEFPVPEGHPIMPEKYDVDAMAAANDPARRFDHPSAKSPQPWRRMLARWMDFTFWLVILAVAFKPFGYSFSNFLLSASAQSFSLLLFVLSESACLAVFGVTPGKAILGLRVQAKGSQGNPPPFLCTLKRTFFVFVYGCALWIFPLMFITWAFHYVSLVRQGATWWDRKLGLETLSSRLQPARAVLFVGVFFALQILLNQLVGDEVRPIVEDMLKQMQVPVEKP